METEQLAKLVDLIRFRIQPQAVNILLDRFPAFREAYDDGLIGEQLGFYIYSKTGDKDGIPSHQGMKPTWTAFASSRLTWQEDQYMEYAYLMALNTRYLFETDANNYFIKDPETGKYVLTEDEKRLQQLENTIIHEMLHIFMNDYNRVGMTGTLYPEQWRDSELTRDEKYAMRNEAMFPTWFKEGLACSVQNTYQYRYESLQLFSYIGEGQFADEYTPEVVLNAYGTTFFRPDMSRRGYESHLDLETSDDNSIRNKVNAQYTTGYLACLYLGELAARKGGDTSISADESWDLRMESEPLRLGIDSILKRLHDGETLDEVIADLSDGRFVDTTDFEESFVKGDEDSLDFCVTYLNYMRELSQQPNREYLAHGSILLDFDLDYGSPIDRNVQGAENAYVITDSNNVVPSTVELLRAYVGGGRSITAPNVDEGPLPDEADETDEADEADTDALMDPEVWGDEDAWEDAESEVWDESDTLEALDGVNDFSVWEESSYSDDNSDLDDSSDWDDGSDRDGSSD